MARKLKSSDQLKLEMLKAELRSNNINTGLKWIGLVVLAFIAYLSIVELAGKYTFAEIGLDFLGHWSVNNVVSWTFSTSGIVYGLSQRELRKRTVERLQERIKKLESEVDPNRTTSGITERGDTRPEDK